MLVHWLLYALLAVALIAGLYINLLGAPGLWLMVVATIVYAIVTGGAYVALKTIGAAIVIAGLAELVEFLVMGAGARKAGASRRGVWGAVIGSVVGGIFFAAIIPIPIIGSIFGVCFGAFVGAIVGELWGGTEVGASLRVGFGAAKGRLFGILTKLTFGIAIIATVLVAARPPFHHTRTMPTTAPILRSP
ncbi:MAG TPA: DUF456 domain-containing protein [Tepidisphaeraceae bacterium]|jgi:hypothetical protein|nr:DUF456 domain-containing protein [Tepidisphaeraceae bacterium]